MPGNMGVVIPVQAFRQAWGLEGASHLSAAQDLSPLTSGDPLAVPQDDTQAPIFEKPWEIGNENQARRV